MSPSTRLTFIRQRTIISDCCTPIILRTSGYLGHLANLLVAQKLLRLAHTQFNMQYLLHTYCITRLGTFRTSGQVAGSSESVKTRTGRVWTATIALGLLDALSCLFFNLGENSKHTQI